jgi:hypothetical protein
MKTFINKLSLVTCIISVVLLGLGEFSLMFHIKIGHGQWIIVSLVIAILTFIVYQLTKEN